jgi:RHS repeat-associated protein
MANARGDVTTQVDAAGNITWQASYEAFGTRTRERGDNYDPQRANSKDEDPTGLLNEGFRYRDLEAGVFISRDPAGFVDGPNVYCYVMQNPWNAFDAEGLWLGFVFDAYYIANDTIQWSMGRINNAEYARRMVINVASVAVNALTGGTGGPSARMAMEGY